MKKVLTVAGSDSGGGAGIQADLKTFAALRVYGTSAITAVTAQNTSRVAGVHTLPAEFVAGQVEAIVEDIGIDALKTGMLANSDIIRAVAKVIRRFDLRPLIIDPVMVAQSGDALMEKEAITALLQDLLPMAAIVTPNLDEAAILADIKINSLNGMKTAAKVIHGYGSDWVLVKGGHMAGSKVTDLLYDGKEFFKFSSPRLQVANTHGSGCTYAAAITAMLSRITAVPEAVEKARTYLLTALEEGLDIGKGSGPLHHFANFYQEWS